MPLQEGVDTAGGYLVPPDLSKQIREKFKEYGLARRLFNVMTTDRDVVQIPKADRTGVTAYVVGEAAAVTASQPSFALEEITVKKIRVKVPVTQELLDDAMIDVVNYVTDAMAWAIAKKEDELIFTGDGTEGITGILNTAGINVKDLDGAYLTPDDISEAIATLEANGASRADLVLIVHPKTLHFLRTLKDSNGNYLFKELTAGNPILQTGAVGTIMGVPIYVSHVLPSASETLSDGVTTAVCTDAILFDKRNAAVFVQRRDIIVEKDKDYDTDVINLYATERIGFKVIYPDLVYHFDKVKNE